MYLVKGEVLVNINKREWVSGRSIQEKFIDRLNGQLKVSQYEGKLENSYKRGDKNVIHRCLSEYLGGYVSGSRTRVMSRHLAGLNKGRADWAM